MPHCPANHKTAQSFFLPLTQLTIPVGLSMAAQHGQLSRQHHSNALLDPMLGDYKQPTVQKFCVMGLQTEMSVSVIVDFHFPSLLLMSANQSWERIFSLIFTLLPITAINALSISPIAQQYLCVLTMIRRQAILAKSTMSAMGKTLS